MTIPDGFRTFFWDLDFDALDTDRDRETVVARIAEHGTDEAVRWLRKTYTDGEIGLAMEARQCSLSRRTLNLWRLWLGKPEDWCAEIPSRPLKGVFWRP